jgi:hypothetical protein
MSTVSVRIDEELVNSARLAAKAEFRTVKVRWSFGLRWAARPSITLICLRRLSPKA